MTKNKGLGRGLSALLANDTSPTMLHVKQLQAGKYQPRSYMDQNALKELAESIKAQGIIQPIVVRPLEQDSYEIIAGERRWRAAQLAGLSTVPVIVKAVSDNDALLLALVENIQREDLNPLEEAKNMQRLLDEFSMTHQQVADTIGRSRVTVSNLLRLLSLAGSVQNLVLRKQLDMGHARALVGLPEKQQLKLAHRVVKNGLSVRETERLVKTESASKPAKVHPTDSTPQENLSRQLSQQWGVEVQVQVKPSAAGERIVLQCSNLALLEKLLG